MINSGPSRSEQFALNPGQLCGFTAIVAMESERALTCGYMTSYGSRRCLSLGDSVPPCRVRELEEARFGKRT